MRRKTRKRAARRAAPSRRRAVSTEATDRGDIALLAVEVASRPETGPALTAGDLDADWRRAHDAGDEAAGGSVATPDQDVVDELGRALGVPQAPDAPLRTTTEILGDRDRFRWHLERDAADAEEGRAVHRRHQPQPRTRRAG